jgi:quercetin dioxygenase-like cupin family protein
MMLVQVTFIAGMRTATHSHPHGQIGYMLAGAINLIIEQKETVRLGSGSSSYGARNVNHGVVPHAAMIPLKCFTPVRADFL